MGDIAREVHDELGQVLGAKTTCAFPARHRLGRQAPTSLNYTMNEFVIHSIGHTMQSTITARGQTVVPAAIRNQFHLGPSDRLEWILDNGSIRVVPVRANPIEAIRGQGKGGATARLLATRKQDLTRE